MVQLYLFPGPLNHSNSSDLWNCSRQRNLITPTFGRTLFSLTFTLNLCHYKSHSKRHLPSTLYPTFDLPLISVLSESERVPSSIVLCKDTNVFLFRHSLFNS